MEMRGSNGGGCCIARYNHHIPNNNTPTYPYSYTSNDTSKMGRIMLRFRPIAPKPAIGGSSSTSSGGSNDNNVGKSNVVVKRKRKANNTTTSKARKDISKKSKACSPSNVILTLPLLPETPDLSPTSSVLTSNNDDNNNLGCNSSAAAPKWLCFGPSDKDLTAQEVFPSSVTVEGISDAWLDGNTSRCTDEEVKKRLDEDTCPGFISDGWNRVWWTNKEYQNMVTRDCKEDTWQKEKLVMSVKLEMRDKMELPAVNLYGAFTCKVKVQYGSHTMTVPCDVWRMNSGGFAWRLDIKAALSLGL